MATNAATTVTANQEAGETSGKDKEVKETWANSKSKALLRTGILSGQIKDTMMPKQVFDMHPEEHGKWKYSNWSNNLRTLRNAVNRDKGRMLTDLKSYSADIAIIKSKRKPEDKIPWHRSEAAKHIKEDVDNGLHEELKPMDLFLTRESYCGFFGLDEFRRHLYQEIDSRPKRAIRYEKKKKSWLYPEIHTKDIRHNEDNK